RYLRSCSDQHMCPHIFVPHPVYISIPTSLPTCLFVPGLQAYNHTTLGKKEKKSLILPC
ncbi:mCG1047192, partial [Mus musculus]